MLIKNWLKNIAVVCSKVILKINFRIILLYLALTASIPLRETLKYFYFFKSAYLMVVKRSICLEFQLKFIGFYFSDLGLNLAKLASPFEFEIDLEFTALVQSLAQVAESNQLN